MSRKYIIINTNELSGLNYNELLTTSENTARKNLAGDKALVSYEGTIPNALSGKTEYNNIEIRAIINDINNGWYEEDEE
tara:strand:+ start:3334 stop:3570 length:237 start_codon:yes stop_codon:yes gene_type:complete